MKEAEKKAIWGAGILLGSVVALSGIAVAVSLHICANNLEKVDRAINNSKTTSLEQTVTQNSEISKTPDLIDLLIEEYKKTGDDTRIRKIAENYEQKRYVYADTIRLYECLNDKEGMQRVAKEYFIQDSFDTSERLLKEYEIEINAEMYHQQGDHRFSDGMYKQAFESYRKANNQEGIIKSEERIREIAELNEDKKNLNDAFESYIFIGDTESAIRVAKKEFINGMFATKEMFDKMNIPITPELWNERGDYKLERSYFDEAIEAYQKAGNNEGIELVKQKALQQYTK